MTPTPFALLDPMVKAANTEPFPFAPMYQPGRAPQPVAPPPAPGSPGSPGNIKHPGVIDNWVGDLAASSIPFGVGSAYMYNKAIGDVRNGRWGSALGNVAWGTLGLIPGVGALRGLFRGAAKGVGALGKAKAGVQGAWRGSVDGGKKMWDMLPGKSALPGAGWKANLTAAVPKVGIPAVAGIGASALLDRAPSAADPNAPAAAAQTSSDPYEQAAQHIDSLGLSKTQ
jgi:hypothetical protein